MAAALRVGSNGDGDGGGFPRWIGWQQRRWLLPTANPAAPTAPVATRVQIRRRQRLLAPEI
uniref:Uncharacterized protein n=1 Tax=Oryza glumipatula TaxID=40148 RepID=A0A0E0A247_9ORYZ